MLDKLALAAVFVAMIAVYVGFVWWSHAMEVGGEAERKARECVGGWKAKSRLIGESALQYWRAAKGLALQSIAEHAPLLRSRTVSGAVVLKIVAVAGWMLPEAPRAWIEAHGVNMLMVIGAGAMLARIIHGRVNARGPLILPGDYQGAATGPGAELERASDLRSFDDLPRVENSHRDLRTF